MLFLRINIEHKYKKMKDLQPFKNSLMSLSYEEKIQMSEWLHTQIELEIGENLKTKTKQVDAKFNSFLDKAIGTFKTIVKK